jgi:hypothetical protein
MNPPPAIIKCLKVNGQTVRYSSDTLPDPPVLSYRTKDELEQLVRDWTSGSSITVDGVGIPLYLWARLYKRTRPKVWTRVKDQWVKFKLFVGGFKSFSSSEEFWEQMLLPPAKPNSGGKVSFTAISNKLREMRSDQDKQDVVRAREEYSDNFDTLFFYKKRGMKTILSQDKDIARHYRLLKKIPRYWDKEEGESDNE